MPWVQSVAWTETARARVLVTRVERSFMFVGGKLLLRPVFYCGKIFCYERSELRGSVELVVRML